jgi:hypothetical protein
MLGLDINTLLSVSCPPLHKPMNMKIVGGSTTQLRPPETRGDKKGTGHVMTIQM